MKDKKQILQITMIIISALIAGSIYGDFIGYSLVLILSVFLSFQNMANKRKARLISLLERSNRGREGLEHVLQRSLFYFTLTAVPLVVIVLTFLCTQFLMISTNVSLAAVLEGAPIAAELARGLFSPNWELLDEAVTVYARQTIEVAILGTIVSFFIALPVSFFCSWNIMNTNILTKLLYYLIRSLVVVIRAVPTFLLGLIFVALVGLGSFPGVLAIIVFSTGIMVKLFSESIESINVKTIEAVSVSGGNRLHIVLFAVIPESLPMIISQTLYCAEVNVHSATVLGLVGAEGIGLPIHEYLSMLAYSNAATFIFITIIMTLIIDQISVLSRKKVLSQR